MIEIKLEQYEEEEIIKRVVNNLSKQILQQEEYWGKVPLEGHYSTFDRFKNQIAQLVADKIYQDIITSGEIAKRINTVSDKAEKNITDAIFKCIKRGEND